MSLIAKTKQESNINPIPAGAYQAVCYGVVDIGTQKTIWQGQEKFKRKVVMYFEIPSERIQIERDGNKLDLPRGMSKKYTLSLSEKGNLYKDLISWRGVQFTPEQLEGFDLFTVIGANCLLQIVGGKTKDGRDMSFINGIMSLPKGMTKLKSENPHVKYSIDEDGLKIPENIPQWTKDEIEKSSEIMAIRKASSNKDLNKVMETYNATEAEYVDPDLQDQPNDDIPF